MVKIKKYYSQREMNDDEKKMVRKKWSVMKVDTEKVSLGLGFLGPKKTVYVVTYQK